MMATRHDTFFLLSVSIAFFFLVLWSTPWTIIRYFLLYSWLSFSIRDIIFVWPIVSFRLAILFSRSQLFVTFKLYFNSIIDSLMTNSFFTSHFLPLFWFGRSLNSIEFAGKVFSTRLTLIRVFSHFSHAVRSFAVLWFSACELSFFFASILLFC